MNKRRHRKWTSRLRQNQQFIDCIENSEISIRHGGAHSPFRLYGDLLLLLGKSRQKPLAPASGPCAALRGSLA
ncbi:hypothetical protein ACNFG0_22840, partial [Pseudomonas sp. NY15372]|uniref:hypothetical protein n=1 Tax=Pseudomonas sp. NY15372 TaxID=3400356 RepID=UPI003A86178C